MIHIKSKIGWTVIVILTAIPLLIWYKMSPMTLRFGSTYGMYTSIGRIAALIGMPLFAISIILSGRFSFLEDFFGGMNKVYVTHHLVGGVGFLLLMVHPLFLSFSQAMISYNKAAMFFIPTEDLSRSLGIYSILIMMLLLILTYYIKLKYNFWKLTHQFMGVSFILGSLHMITAESDITNSLPLRWYLICLFSIGMAVYFYRTVLGSKLVHHYSFLVIAIEQVGADVWNIRLRPTQEMFYYMPGQFLFVSFHSRGISTEYHPFSISSSPLERDLTLTIKSAGDFTSTLKNLEAGCTAKIEGPFGRFFSKRFKNQIWIAGGIGVTPFLSMARSLQNPPYLIDLYYVVRGQAEAVYMQDLLAIAQKEPNFRFALYDTSVEKRITAEIIKQTSGDISSKDIYICGPPPMMKSLRAQFNQLGIHNSSIHTEEFQML